ncbi:MAG: alpha-galactosidase [Lentisphaeria bacterium]|nr:alpha-galactosidase [Lentisphaeria bacterium]
MSCSWKPRTDNGYSAVIETDFPADAVVYTANMMMAQGSPLAPLTCGMHSWGDLSSGGVIAVGTKGHYLLAGAVTAFRSLTILRAVYDSRRITRIEMFQPDIKPGETPEESVILEGPDWRELLTRYADIAAAKMGVKPIPEQKNMTGYCTWYYYYKDVSEAHMLENIEALAANRSPYAAEYVQIDDGYQTFQGDWLDQCETWPTPVREIAEKITSRGMKAGIWTMPTTASTASRVYREHPDWFVKDENGNTVTLPGWSPAPDHLWACLDATVPEAREHITKVFKTFRSWGFTYFKMDGLYFGFQRGVRRDPDATAVSAFRLLLKTIREAVPDSILMACSAPFLPCLGLVDNARVSNDTSRYFHSTREYKNAPQCCGCSIADAFHISMANFWCFDRWFRADPDVIMARQDNAFYTRGQAKISVLAGIMTGLSLTSDHLGKISPERNALLAKAQNIRMRNARPLNSIPNIWPQEFEGTVDGRRAVALVNDTRAEKVWKLAELGLPEHCRDLLDDREVFNEITMNGEDAALLIEA